MPPVRSSVRRSSGSRRGSGDSSLLSATAVNVTLTLAAPILGGLHVQVLGVRPAGIEPATKCLEGARERSGRQGACRLTKATGTWLVRGGTVATGPVVVAVVVGKALGLRACPHSCRAFRRWTAVKVARATNRRPRLRLGLDRRPAAVRTIGGWEGLPGGEGRGLYPPMRSAPPAPPWASRLSRVRCRVFSMADESRECG